MSEVQRSERLVWLSISTVAGIHPLSAWKTPTHTLNPSHSPSAQPTLPVTPMFPKEAKDVFTDFWVRRYSDRLAYLHHEAMEQPWNSQGSLLKPTFACSCPSWLLADARTENAAYSEQLPVCSSERIIGWICVLPQKEIGATYKDSCFVQSLIQKVHCIRNL